MGPSQLDHASGPENGQKIHKLVLVGGFNPSEKYARQNGNPPQIGVKIKNV